MLRSIGALRALMYSAVAGNTPVSTDAGFQWLKGPIVCSVNTAAASAQMPERDPVLRELPIIVVAD